MYLISYLKHRNPDQNTDEIFKTISTASRIISLDVYLSLALKIFNVKANIKSSDKY